MEKSKFSLDELRVESFVTQVDKLKADEIIGGADTEYTTITSKCDPSTNESTVSTCACGQTDCVQTCPPR